MSSKKKDQILFAIWSSGSQPGGGIVHQLKEADCKQPLISKVVNPPSYPLIGFGNAGITMVEREAMMSCTKVPGMMRLELSGDLVRPSLSSSILVKVAMNCPFSFCWIKTRRIWLFPKKLQTGVRVSVRMVRSGEYFMANWMLIGTMEDESVKTKCPSFWIQFMLNEGSL